MHKQLQLELFKTSRDRPKIYKADRHRPSFFSIVKIHEKAILIAIGFIIVSLVSFSLGVEKGKGLVKEQSENPQEKNLYAQQASKEKTSEKKADKSEVKAGYTVQVATFRTETYAQKEADRLKKRGLETLIIPRGGYVTVCVGNFSGRKEAKISLNQLKKTYQDCFIRRL
jgi:preprotein translocase subunit SecF